MLFAVEVQDRSRNRLGKELKGLMNSLRGIIDEIPTAPPSGINQLKWKWVKELQVAI